MKKIKIFTEKIKIFVEKNKNHQETVQIAASRFLNPH